MPECIYNRVEVEMSRKERKIYEDLLPGHGGADRRGQKWMRSALALLSNKLLQMANGAVYNSDGKVLPIHDRKLDALEDLVEAANGKPLLVAYWYKHDLSRIRERFPQARCIDTSKDITDWNAMGRSRWRLIHPASAGHGLNSAGGRLHHRLVWPDLVTGAVPAAERQTLETGDRNTRW